MYYSLCFCFGNKKGRSSEMSVKLYKIVLKHVAEDGNLKKAEFFKYVTTLQISRVTFSIT